MVVHLSFSCGKCMDMLSSLPKILGVCHQVTNKLLELPGAEAHQIVMFSVIQLIGGALIDRVW